MKSINANVDAPIKRIAFVALSIGVLGLTPTVSVAEPTMQEQLETLKLQLTQQQQMMQEMQRQLDRRFSS